MEIEEAVYDILRTAEFYQPQFRPEINRFSNNIDYFKNTEDGECDLEEGKAVSKQMMDQEAVRMANLIDEHEKMYKKVNQALDDIDECSDHKFVNGKQFDNYNTKKKLNKIVERYDRDFEEAGMVSNRAKMSDKLNSPVYIRSTRRKREASRKYSEEVESNAWELLDRIG